MRIAITGSSGFIGSSLAAFLSDCEQEVFRLVRRPAQSAHEISWDPESGVLDQGRMEGLDAVVHLAGENIATGRWTTAKKKRIRESRVGGTRFLCESLGHLSRRPRVLVSASAIGYYGDQGDALLDEESPGGEGFLAEVCGAWEAATEAAKNCGLRVVNLRIGMVLSPKGGALTKMLFPFRLGLGGRMGNGRQCMSWIALPDLLSAIFHALERPELAGPVNAVSPRPVTNREFAKTLGRVLHRPAIFPMPAFAARLAFGEMADALVLASTRVWPRRLLASGFQFQYPELENALEHVLSIVKVHG